MAQTFGVLLCGDDGARLEEIELKVVELTCSEPPGEVTHWTGRALAKAVGVSHGTVQRIRAKHDLQPHRIKTFKRSNAERCGSPVFSICREAP